MSVQKWSNLEGAAITLFDNTTAGLSGGQHGVAGLPNGYRKAATIDDGAPDIIVNGVVENANGYTHAMLFFNLAPGSGGTTPLAGTPNAGGYFAVYFLPTLDGTTFPTHEVYGNSIFLPVRCHVGSFNVVNGNAANVMPIIGAKVPPSPFKVVIENRTGVSVQPTGGGSGQIGAATAITMKRYTLNTV
jgi:hypothetical protein